MKHNSFLFIFCVFFVVNCSYAQTAKLGKYELVAINSSVSNERLMNKPVIKVIKDSSIVKVDEPTYARVRNIRFSNGIIEVKVLSRLQKTAPNYARGFIGVAFRINESNTQYESIYVRPVNARVNDQVRRNHSIQYYSYPNYKFDTLRIVAPEKYESYTDMEMNKWIDLRIEVKDAEAKLYINKSKQPSLVVTDLKLGTGVSGGVALWVEIGTEGYFRDLKITTKE
jgi:hypothetical protein